MLSKPEGKSTPASIARAREPQKRGLISITQCWPPESILNSTIPTPCQLSAVRSFSSSASIFSGGEMDLRYELSPPERGYSCTRSCTKCQTLHPRSKRNSAPTPLPVTYCCSSTEVNGSHCRNCWRRCSSVLTTATASVRSSPCIITLLQTGFSTTGKF